MGTGDICNLKNGTPVERRSIELVIDKLICMGMRELGSTCVFEKYLTHSEYYQIESIEYNFRFSLSDVGLIESTINNLFKRCKMTAFFLEKYGTAYRYRYEWRYKDLALKYFEEDVIRLALDNGFLSYSEMLNRPRGVFCR